MFFRGETFEITGQEDALALTTSFWLDDEGLVSLPIKLTLEVLPVEWQAPCLWEEIVFIF